MSKPKQMTDTERLILTRLIKKIEARGVKRTELLDEVLGELHLLFRPRSFKESADIIASWLTAASISNAADNAMHHLEHPKTARRCIVDGTERIVQGFGEAAKMATKMLFEEHGFPDPYPESEVNERTRKEILDQLAKEQS